MKCRVLSLLLALGLLCSLFPAVSATEEESSSAVTALCVAQPREAVFLDDKEFQSLCRQATGHDLECVTFSSLSPAVGKLTYQGEKIAAGDSYYMYRKPALSRLCFTPYFYSEHSDSQFTGQAELAFTMTSDRDETVSGTLIFYVPEPSAAPEDAPSGRTVLAQAGKAIDLCDHLPTVSQKEDCSAVFSLPSSSQGSLWLGYAFEESRRKLLPEESLFFDREPNFYDLTFVPAGNEEADIRLDYTVLSERGQKRASHLTLSFRENKEPVLPSLAAPEPAPFTITTQTTPEDLTAPLRSACKTRNLGTLDTVLFEALPLPEEGVIFYQNTPVTAGKFYSCASDSVQGYKSSQFSFVPGNAFLSDIPLRYVATDSIGYTYSGYLTLSPGYPSELRFRDLAGWEWAMPAAEFLGKSGYLSSETSFSPGSEATRMDLIHALVLTAYSSYFSRKEDLASTFPDLPDDPALCRSAAIAAERGLVLGDGEGRLLPDASITRQDALVILYRAMADRHKTLPLYGDLSAFSDAGEIAPYAQEAVTLLAAKGVVLGNGAGKLEPLSPITRAEMACLLYRAFG